MQISIVKLQIICIFDTLAQCTYVCKCILYISTIICVLHGYMYTRMYICTCKCNIIMPIQYIVLTVVTVCLVVQCVWWEVTGCGEDLFRQQ